jgi:hypothetical protein
MNDEPFMADVVSSCGRAVSGCQIADRSVCLGKSRSNVEPGGVSSTCLFGGEHMRAFVLVFHMATPDGVYEHCFGRPWFDSTFRGASPAFPIAAQGVLKCR